MDEYFIRWMCAYCHNIHTRRIKPSKDRLKHEVVYMETFDSPFPEMGNESKELTLRKAGNSVLLTLGNPADLTCIRSEATVPYERTQDRRRTDA